MRWDRESLLANAWGEHTFVTCTTLYLSLKHVLEICFSALKITLWPLSIDVANLMGV